MDTTKTYSMDIQIYPHYLMKLGCDTDTVAPDIGIVMMLKSDKNKQKFMISYRIPNEDFNCDEAKVKDIVVQLIPEAFKLLNKNIEVNK